MGWVDGLAPPLPLARHQAPAIGDESGGEQRVAREGEQEVAVLASVPRPNGGVGTHDVRLRHGSGERWAFPGEKSAAPRQSRTRRPTAQLRLGDTGGWWKLSCERVELLMVDGRGEGEGATLRKGGGIASTSAGREKEDEIRT